MTKYGITGMSCAACSARIEKVVGRIEGVKSCSVSLLTNSMVVEGDVKSEVIIAAVENAGFKATLQADIIDRDTPILRKRLFCSIGFLLVLMYLSMGYTMFNFPLPSFLDRKYTVIALIQMALTIVIMVINRKFFTSGFSTLCKLAPNMDSLVALGATASFVWSFFNLVLIALAEISNTPGQASSFFHDLYFESTGMILTLITVGKLLEARSKGRTTDAIKSLMQLVDITQIIKGDEFEVKPGERIQADGIIIEGTGSIDESALTGESIPADKEIDDKVYAGTIMSNGYIKCRATEVGSDTALSKIVTMVSESAATKAPIARIADKVSGIFVPAVIAIAVITFAVWLLIGKEMSFALSRAVSVLVISCPCALGLATPVAIMVGNGIGAKNNILFKTSEALENLGKVKTVAFDKTGTITKGLPSVTDVITLGDTSKDDLLNIAYLLEKKSEHPLAKAVVNYYEKEYSDLQDRVGRKFELSDFTAMAGSGVKGKLKDGSEDGKLKEVYGGNLKFIKESAEIPFNVDNEKNFAEAEAVVSKLSNAGKTPLIFATDSKILGIIAVADEIKEDSRKAVQEIKKLGINVVMLTGDNRATALSIAKLAGLNESDILADVMPDKKAEKIKELKEAGMVAMVGDGINDAPALTVSDIGVAIGAGADIAIESAGVVLMKDSLMDVYDAIRLSRATLRNIKQNLFWAFFYNIICIPLAAGVYYHLFGLVLNPMIGALAMSLSSFCVVSNALRLNTFKRFT